MSFFKCGLSVTLISALLASVDGTCIVTSQRCVFPSSHHGEPMYSCAEMPTKKADDINTTVADDEDQPYFCRSNPVDDEEEGRQVWSQCNGGCFESDGGPMDFSGPMESMALMCKTVPMECVFPFVHLGTTYENCTKDTMTFLEYGDPVETFHWCATKTDDNGEMLKDFWGVCQMDTCTQPDEDPEKMFQTDESEAIVAEIQISADSNVNNVSANLLFEQKSPDGPLRITGEVSGLSEGNHGFHVHNNSDTADECMAAGGHYNPKKVLHGGPDSAEKHAGDFGNIAPVGPNGTAYIDMEVTHATLFGDLSIIGRTLVIHSDPDDLGVNDNEGSRATGNAGGRLACGLIHRQGALTETELTHIIIIVLAIVIVILLILITLLLCYCLKKRRERDEKVRDDLMPFQNGDMKKTPLYDELSIPFIDASPTPTPKAGRSTERLSFFNRTPSIGRSRGSLSNEDVK